MVKSDNDTMVLNCKAVAQIGLAEAAMLNRLTMMAEQIGVEYEGRRWLPWSIRSIQAQLTPWWSVSTANRILLRMIEHGLVATMDYPHADNIRWLSPNTIVDWPSGQPTDQNSDQEENRE